MTNAKDLRFIRIAGRSEQRIEMTIRLIGRPLTDNGRKSTQTGCCEQTERVSPMRRYAGI